MLPSYGCRAADKLCPWISTQFFARRVCSVTKFAGRAEKRPGRRGQEPGIVQVADGKWAEMESERAQKKGCFSCF